jgi:hypothetical protein
MDEIRIINDEVMWSEPFDPPTSAYSSDPHLIYKNPLTIHSEASTSGTIYGDYSMRIDALISGSINHTVSRTFNELIKCTGHNVLKFDTKASRIGKNLEISLINTSSSGIDWNTTKTINHSYSNIWQKETINITNNNDLYDKIEFKILNDDADNTIYIDNMSFGMPDIYWIDSFEYPTDEILRNNWITTYSGTTNSGIALYTDNSSPTYGNFSLRAETVISGSKTYGFEKEFTQDIGLKDYNSLSFDTKSNRVGENVEFSMIVDTSTSGTQETVSKKIHHNDINIWQKEIIDFSSLFDTSLFYIRKIAFNILNDDLDNIFYIDNMYLSDFQPPIDEPVIIKNLSLSIDHTKIDEDLTNFPLMISLVSGTCDIFDQLGENNLKFKIETEDGTQCYTEIEDWNYSNGKACLWTKVPTIASSVDTKLTLTYSSSFDDNVSYIGTTGSGVSYNVWDDNFVAVYHMNQDPSTGGACLLDSTSNDNDSTPDGAMTRGDLVDGDHGKALDFDGSNDHSHLPTFGVFDGSSDFTVSARIKIDTIKECRLFSFWGENILAGVFGDNTDNNIYSVRLRSDSIWSTPVQTNALSASTWYTLTVRYDTTNGFVLFVDGSSVDTSSAIAIDSYSDVSQISGQNTSSDRYFDGLISHIEISDTNRTFAWIKAAHTTLTNNLITIT